MRMSSKNTLWCQNNIKEILDEFKDIHFAEALRYLILGQGAHGLIEKFQEDNKKKKPKVPLSKEKQREQTQLYEEKLLDYLKKNMPLGAECMSLETYRRWAHFYEVILECPPFLFLFMEKEHITIQISPSIIWKKHTSILQFINAMKLSNENAWNEIMGFCANIPLEVVKRLPPPIQKVINQASKDVRPNNENNTNQSSSSNNNNNNNVRRVTPISDFDIPLNQSSTTNPPPVPHWPENNNINTNRRNTSSSDEGDMEEKSDELQEIPNSEEINEMIKDVNINDENPESDDNDVYDSRYDNPNRNAPTQNNIGDLNKDTTSSSNKKNNKKKKK